MTTPLKYLLTATLLLFLNTVLGQYDLSIQWQHNIGTAGQESLDHTLGRSNNVMVQCADGGYAVVAPRPYNENASCNRNTWTGERVWLLRFDRYGVLLWEKCFGGVLDNYWHYSKPTGVVQAPDGGFVLCGTTSFTDGDFATQHGAWDAFVIRTDSSGNLRWSRCYGGTGVETFNSILSNGDGTFVAAGSASSENGDVTGMRSNYDGWVVQIDSTGSILWQRPVGNFYDEEHFYSVKKASDGSFIAVGGLTACISSQGTVLWQNGESGSDLALDARGNIYITAFNQYSSEVRKLTAAGNRSWSKILWTNQPGGSNATALHCLNDTTIALLGSTNSQHHLLAGLHRGTNTWAYKDYYISLLDTSGNDVYTRCFGGSAEEQSTYFIPTADKGFLIMGLSHSTDGDIFQNRGSADFWLVKVGGYNTIKGKLFYDYNANGVQDGSETLFRNVLVTSDKRGSFNGSWAGEGTFRYTVDTGAYTTQPRVQRPYYTIRPATLETSHSTYGRTDSVDFAIVPLPGIKDLTVTLGARHPQRPGFTNTLTLVCINRGTEMIQEAVVSLVKDPRMTITAHDSASFAHRDDTLTWRLQNLEPLVPQTITLHTVNATPPALAIGDSLLHFIGVTPLAGDSTDFDNTDTVRQEVVGSFDPNNKLDDVGGVLYLERYRSGAPLGYTINFQNTGTDTAFTVVVRDTLSALFDEASLEMVAASHPYTLSVQKGRYLQWTFHHINLPDSNRNEPRSHGYLLYTVKPETGLAVGTRLLNRASIYFDYNLPVQTNEDTVVISHPPPPLPLLGGLKDAYCRNEGSKRGKILNLLPAGASVTVRLDNTALTVAADSTFSFDVSALAAGAHTLSVEFVQHGLRALRQHAFSVTMPGVLDLAMAATPATLTDPAAQVVIQAQNRNGGSGFTFGFFKDRALTQPWIAEGANNVLALYGNQLTEGANWIYGRIGAPGQCYTEAYNTDSVLVTLTRTTGLVDVDAPGRLITLQPVPFDRQLTVKGLDAGSPYELALLNNSGREVYRTGVAHRATAVLNLPSLPAGIYYLQLTKRGKLLGAIRVVRQ